MMSMSLPASVMLAGDVVDPFCFRPNPAAIMRDAAMIMAYSIHFVESDAQPELNRDGNGAQKLTEPTAVAAVSHFQRSGYGESYVTEQSEESKVEDQEGHDDDEPKDLQGEKIEIPVADQAGSKISNDDEIDAGESELTDQLPSEIANGEVKTGDDESKILGDSQPELKVAADVGYLHNEENTVVKDPREEEVQSTTISSESAVHAGKMKDLRVVQRSDEKSIGEKNSAPKKDEEELRAEGSIRVHFKELSSEAEEVKSKQFKESKDA